MARPRKQPAGAHPSLLTADAAPLPELPVAEQPYPLPTGWKWVRLGSVISLYRGVSYKKEDAHSAPHQNDCLILRGGNIGEGTINLEADNVYVDKSLVSEHQIIKKFDIIIVTSTGSTKVIGRAGVSPQDYSNVAFGAFLTLARTINGFNKKYISLYFQTQIYRERIQRLSKGVNINNVRSEYITECELPLPPREEQERIVARIESLFARLDEAREKVDAVVEGSETRKAALLHKAFSGELTAKWREEKGVDITSWETKILGALADLQTGLMKGRKTTGPTVSKPYLRVANVQDGFFDLSEIKRIEVEQEQVGRWILQNEDVLFTEGGDFDKLGRGAVWEEQIADCLHQNHIFVVRVHKNILNPYFLSYQTRSKYGKEYFLACSKQTTNLASINSTQLKKFPVRLPPLPEQEEIVRLLDSLLERERQIREAAEQVRERIDLMKKAILARAFRGELG
ncbi:restriction endonuclease subunit S [uncultured Desulfovibrio sp.]|uniref:restriction endonuclease subunit S n=1 Tax=uncultured Desulfovibrio sp. TaxID=167968 RepID=UPI00262F8179|nr:restriction endonuclease subunit S [uncultured Desulfovibrio sp.]